MLGLKRLGTRDKSKRGPFKNIRSLRITCSE